MTRWIAVLVLATCARVPSAPLPVDAVSGATPRYLATRMDPHQVHAVAPSCTGCHHADAASRTHCDTCHADEGRRVLHTRCLSCHREEHEKKADLKAPVECLQCHEERP